MTPHGRRSCFQTHPNLLILLSDSAAEAAMSAMVMGLLIPEVRLGSVSTATIPRQDRCPPTLAR